MLDAHLDADGSNPDLQPQSSSADRRPSICLNAKHYTTSLSYYEAVSLNNLFLIYRIVNVIQLCHVDLWFLLLNY